MDGEAHTSTAALDHASSAATLTSDVVPSPCANKSASKIHGNLSWIDRLLPLWIGVCMVVGVLLGYYVPSVRTAFDSAKIFEVSVPIAVGLLWMMYPVLCKVKYEELSRIFSTPQVWKQLGVSMVLNWIVGPLLMTGLAWATLPDLPGYRSGVILVGVARCIAMVLIWNQLAGGDSEYCAILVAVNSVFQIILYSPFAYLFGVVIGGGSSVNVDIWMVTRSVLIFLGIPLAAGIITRFTFRNLLKKWFGPSWFDKKFLPVIGPTALVGLCFTVLVMFCLQGRRIVEEIGQVLRVCVPLLIYFTILFFLTFVLCRYLKFPYNLSVTQAFTASSNNFELAIAVAVATYGIDSQEALATTVGPLIEVPVLLGLVYVSLWIGEKMFHTQDVERQGGQVGVGEDGKEKEDNAL